MSKKRILVVEDEAIVARDLSKRLEGMGYQVVAMAGNSDSAIAEAEAQKPDLVLMDIVLKGQKDGIMTADMIKGSLGIPVIYLTAYADESTLERAKVTEPFGYIIKPFNDRDLNVTIQMALYRNQMEKKLIEREKRYRDLFENTNDIIMILDENGFFKYVNQRWHAALGYSADEIKTLSLFDILAPDCLKHCRDDFKKVLSGENITVEAVFRTKKGKAIIVEGNCNSSLSPGKPALVRGIFRDITEKKKSQELQEALYSIANETALSGNLDELYPRLHNIIRRLMDTKNFYIAIYDKEKDRLSFPYFVDEYDPAPQSRNMGKGITEYVIRSKKPLLATPPVFQSLTDLGDVRTVGQPSLDWLGVPLLISDRYTGVLVVQTYDQGIRFGEREKNILTFISGQVAFAIQRKQAEMEKVMMEQTLNQTRKMEAIGQLAGGIAHDFNNLLSGIMGNAEMLAMKLSNEPVLHSLAEQIVDTSEHAASLTRQLLTFARKGSYQHVPVNIHRVIPEVVRILENTIDRRVNIKQNLQANPATVLCDPILLENAILNLSINARDAMPNGGDLTISTKNVELDENYIKMHGHKIPAGRYIQLSVSDTGEGMTPEVKEHLFEPFFTTKEQGKGTGLGLASVYGCVTSHNGAIEVYSEKGHGAIFKIYLPVLEKDVIVQPETIEPGGDRGTETILLVDDEEMVRDITSQMLEDVGYKVITCRDGAEAVDYYTKNHAVIDLIILDMIMPRMNGKDAYKKIKAINAGAKVLLSSGYSIEGDAEEILNDGVRGIIQKPYRINELTGKIRKVLAGE